MPKKEKQGFDYIENNIHSRMTLMMTDEWITINRLKWDMFDFDDIIFTISHIFI